MVTVNRTLVVNIPAERIFPYLADFTSTAEWEAGTVRCAQASGDGGVGSTYTKVWKFLGREQTLTYVLTALELDRLIAWRGENKSMICEETITLTPSGTGTEVTYAAELTVKGVARYLGPLLTAAANRLADTTQETLRDALVKR